MFPTNPFKNDDVIQHTDSISMNEINGANNLAVCEFYLYGLG